MPHALKESARVLDAKPLILIADPEPRTLDMIFEPEVMARLQGLAKVVVYADAPGSSIRCPAKAVCSKHIRAGVAAANLQTRRARDHSPDA
ncbi:hypothetical protein [Mesorhizobium sp. A623]